MFTSEDKIKIIKHSRKTLLFNNEILWIKKGARGNYDNPLRVYGGVKICELVGCLLLYNLNNIIYPCNHSLYRVDGLITVDNCNSRKSDVIRKNWVAYLTCLDLN